MKLEVNSVIHADCFDVFPHIKDQSIDMILADMPYGTTNARFDSVLDLAKLWEQYKRIIKENGCIALFGQTPFDKILGASNPEMLKYEWIWEKSKATGHLNAKRSPMKAHENILIFYKKPPTYNPQMTQGKPYKGKGGNGIGDGDSNYGTYGTFRYDNDGTRYPRSVLRFNSVSKPIHITEKPLELLQYLINTYTNEGELILDNCAGSGSLGGACVNTKRNYILIEKELEYYNKIVERLNKC